MRLPFKDIWPCAIRPGGGEQSDNGLGGKRFPGAGFTHDTENLTRQERIQGILRQANFVFY